MTHYNKDGKAGAHIFDETYMHNLPGFDAPFPIPERNSNSQSDCPSIISENHGNSKLQKINEEMYEPEIRKIEYLGLETRVTKKESNLIKINSISEGYGPAKGKKIDPCIALICELRHATIKHWSMMKCRVKSKWFTRQSLFCTRDCFQILFLISHDFHFDVFKLMNTKVYEIDVLACQINQLMHVLVESAV